MPCGSCLSCQRSNVRFAKTVLSVQHTSSSLAYFVTVAYTVTDHGSMQGLNALMTYQCATIYSTTFLETVGWIQGSPVCSRANTALIYIQTSEMCSTHHSAAMQFIIVPVHLHAAERKTNC